MIPMRNVYDLMKLVVLSVILMVGSSSNAQEANEKLLAASLHGNVQDIKKAMALSPDINCRDKNGNTPLNMVAKLSYYKLVKYFIEAGADVNIANNDKISPLHWAVEYNNVKMVLLLLQNEANHNASDALEETPLHWAGWTGNIESARLLLKFGANPFAKNSTSLTPLDLSVKQEHRELEKLLRKKKYKKRQGS